jgi:hypothetical protein
MERSPEIFTRSAPGMKTDEKSLPSQRGFAYNSQPNKNTM